MPHMVCGTKAWWIHNYLWTCAISKRVQSHLWSVLKAGGEEVIDVTDDKIDNGYAQIISQDRNFISVIWQSRLDINSFIDCGMHLIFHGVLASIVEVLNSVFTDIKLGTAFENTVNVYLSEIESFRLEWCNTTPVPKKQWLVENELALSRILPFVYTTFF